MIVSGVPVELTPEEVEEVRRRLKREPTPVEIGMIDVMWSEHCSYKSSKAVLRILPRRSKKVIVGPGQDAGVVDIGDGLAVVFKIESHNHPSAIEPYNGAATGIGGIIRDVLCMGARPIALLDPLRFGKLSSRRSVWLFKNVVKGIADYGNRTGIPTVAGEVEFDEDFEANCLVNVACVGIARRERIIPSIMRNPGDIIVVAGGGTGRDGIHGVTFASRTLTEKSEEDRPAVQVGDAFTKKVLIDATLEAIETGYVTGLKDLGGGGITCATSEMSNKGGTGVELEIDKLHVREEGMSPYELMLSESQERMLFVVKPEGLETVTRIFEKYGIPYSIVGRVTDTGRLVVKYKGEVVADIPPWIIVEAPLARRESRKPEYVEKAWEFPRPPVPEDLEDAFLKVLSSPNVASKEWVYRQYDHEVGIRTVLKPGDGDAAVLRLLEKPGRAIAVTVDGNSKWCYLDPFNGHAGVVAEAVRNITAVGGEPLAVADGCNFGNPEKPEVYWQFKRSVQGLAYMLRALGIPCVGGNVSFYNEDEVTKRAVKPTIFVVMVGLVKRLEWVKGMGLREEGDPLFVVGKTYPELGGSEYYYAVHGVCAGIPPKPDPEAEIASMKLVREAIRRDYALAVHDCSSGGLSVCVAEMCIKGSKGASVELQSVPSACGRLDELLFSESHARYVVEVRKGHEKEFLKLSKELRVPVGRLGSVGGDELVFTWKGSKVIEASLADLEKAWKESIPRAVGDLPWKG